MWRGQLSEMESSGEIRRLVLRSSFRVPIPSGPVLLSHWTPTCIDSSFLQIIGRVKVAGKSTSSAENRCSLCEKALLSLPNPFVVCCNRPPSEGGLGDGGKVRDVPRDVFLSPLPT
ncbi:hypothetical protein CDAR_450391 [Caerostris darwini]|uniref:Uncharacterized protein n=1 Tax=Caerostris darwini TaxID=1538125 RepID=A0AAV4NDY0_9ARAC|nr:hypothetical protein CDAR_450391 [Caerostris darwini]